MKSLQHFKDKIKKPDTPKKRLCLLYGWVKNGDIEFSRFTELLTYLETVEDIKDREFTEAKLKTIREGENQ